MIFLQVFEQIFELNGWKSWNLLFIDKQSENNMKFAFLIKNTRTLLQKSQSSEKKSLAQDLDQSKHSIDHSSRH